MAQVSIRIEDDLKRDAEELFNSLGLTTSTAINIFLKASVRKNGLPFDLTLDDPFYSPYNQRILRESIADANAGKLTKHDLIELEE